MARWRWVLNLSYLIPTPIFYSGDTVEVFTHTSERFSAKSLAICCGGWNSDVLGSLSLKLPMKVCGRIKMTNVKRSNIRCCLFEMSQMDNLFSRSELWVVRQYPKRHQIKERNQSTSLSVLDSFAIYISLMSLMDSLQYISLMYMAPTDSFVM